MGCSSRTKYDYDDADREILRELVQEGRAFQFSYDADSRLFSAQEAAPPSAGQSVSRTFFYDTTGADALASVVTVTSTGSAPADFIESASNFDAFGLPGTIKLGGVSYPQNHDALGNVTRTLIAGGLGDLSYDGFSRLRHVARADGATIDYLYRPDGALLSRNIVCNGASACTAGKTTFVYDGLLLRETYDTTGATPVLTRRYFYACQRAGYLIAAGAGKLIALQERSPPA